MFALRQIRRFSVLNKKCVIISSKNCFNLKHSHVTYRRNVQKLNSYFFKPISTTKINYKISNETVKISEAFSKLDNNYKQQQRIRKSDIEHLISCIENEDIINEDKYLLLLQCCGHLIPDELPSERICLVQKTWKTLVDKKINLTVDHYNALLQCYIENKVNLTHKEFLSSMVCEPNNQTYDLLLECVCESGDLNQAIEIVNIMKEKCYAVNERIFSTLIYCHLRNGDVKSAQHTLETMRIAHVIPSSSTYTALLKGYAENSEIYLFTNTLTKAQNREMSIKQLISILFSICISKNLELLPLIKKTWAFKMDTRTFQSQLQILCVYLIHSQKPEIAYKLFKNIIDLEVGFLTESDTYGSFLIYELIKSKTPSDIIIKTADDLINTNKNIYALFKATEIALRIPDVNLSLSLLQALFDRKNVLKNHYFWPILIREGLTYGEKGIFNIFNEMLKLNVPIEAETLEVYSLQYIKNLDPDILINKLKQFNLTVTDVLSPIAIVLLRQSKIKQVADLTTKYKVKLDGNKLIKQLASAFVLTNDIKSTTNILQNICLKNHSEDWAGQLIFYVLTRSGTNINYQYILNLLKAYKLSNIKISGTYIDINDSVIKKIKDDNMMNKMKKVLNSIDTENSVDHNSYILHPRNMNLQELECHLIELRNKQMDLRGILRKLIQAHCRIGNANRVSELYLEFEKAGYSVSPGMKSSLLDLFLKSEQFEKAWNTYKELKEYYPSFAIDNFKIVHLANLCCKNKNFNDAIKLLENESSHRKIMGGNSIQHKCWNLLNCVARTGNVIETKTIFKILTENNYCTESNIILGPLIRVHMCNNNKADAVEEYVSCCTKYKKTPLLHELMCFIVKNESSSDLIQKVVESTIAIHGPGQTQTTLAAALAETGLTKTLRKLFLDSNIQLAQHLLEQYCQKWIKDNKIQALNNLIKATEGLTHINLSAVYLNLIRFYSSNNDSDSALSLWNQIQEKNIFPSLEIKNLIDEIEQSRKQMQQENL